MRLASLGITLAKVSCNLTHGAGEIRRDESANE